MTYYTSAKSWNWRETSSCDNREGLRSSGGASTEGLGASDGGWGGRGGGGGLGIGARAGATILGEGGERGKRAAAVVEAEAGGEDEDAQSELLSHSGTPFFPIALASPVPFPGASASIGVSQARSSYRTERSNSSL